MKAVITIFQNRRAVLPHIFLEYVLPRMREVFPGEIDAVLVQHRADASGGNRRLESLRNPEGLDRVRRWTEEGRYDAAEIIPHSIIHRPYPSIPTFHHGVQAAVERDADFHIWMEDDALIIDFDCGWWDDLLGPSEVGVYRRFHHLNSAYLVTRRSYAERILPYLADYDAWKERSRLEAFMRETLTTSRAYLNPARAVRYHHQYYPYTGLRYVVEAVRQLAPEALPLLDEDFGEGAHLLPPVTPAEMAQHAAADGSKPVDRLWRMRTRFVEQYRRIREGQPMNAADALSWKHIKHWKN